MIGEKLGNYTIIEIVGSGGVGTVYKAEDPDGKIVALKLVRSLVLHSMEKRERFLQCLLTASEICHKCICPILEIGDDNDDFFIVTPFVRGKTLEQYMGHQPIAWSQVLTISQAVASALQAIHDAGAVHGGLKPANIWIPDNSEQTVLITDCGFTRFTEIGYQGGSRPCNRRDAFAHSPILPSAMAYMSPEQIRGDTVDHRSDIFSLGIVLYEMLTGRYPFDARSSLSCVSTILDAEPSLLDCTQMSIPVQFDTTVRRALAKNREERYLSIDAMMADLQSAGEGSSAKYPRVMIPTGIRKWFGYQLRRALGK